MTKLLWDQVGERLFETGVDHGVLYIPTGGVYSAGYAWNGLVNVTESPSGAEPNKQYADNIPYVTLVSSEEFGGTIEAFTYPDQFAQCDGSVESSAGVLVGQQNRKTFGLCYRTLIGNDTDGLDHGYKLHLVYGCLAAPSERAYGTVNDSPEAATLSWELSTTPVEAPGFKPTATITIDSTKVAPADLAELEDILYGTASTTPRLPLPAEVFAIFNAVLTEVTPAAPTYVSGTDTLTIPTVTGVEYRDQHGTLLAAGAQVITEDKLVKAYPLPGYKFPALVDDEWYFDYIA